MNAVAKGIAHVSFSGGGTFLPARNPYDRQLLIEHVSDRARAKGQVQVLVQDQLWMVQRNRGPNVARCARCRMPAATACYSKGCDETCYCVSCAFGSEMEALQPQGAAERRVG
jgi:hypothetical protein